MKTGGAEQIIEIKLYQIQKYDNRNICKAMIYLILKNHFFLWLRTDFLRSECHKCVLVQ